MSLIGKKENTADDIVGDILFDHDGRSIKGQYEALIRDLWRKADYVIPLSNENYRVRVSVRSHGVFWKEMDTVKKELIRRIKDSQDTEE